MLVMATKKNQNQPADARKPFKMVRVRKVLADIAETRAESLVQDLTQYINDAVRMRLETEGYWPPPPKPPAK